MKRIVVVGLGNFGASAAAALHALGHEVIALDRNEDAVDRISRHVTRAAVADGRSKALLDRLGCNGADVGIVSTGDDVTASILTTLALKDLGVGSVTCKVISDDHARVMARIGADETVFPEQESGRALATRLSGGALLNLYALGAGHSVQEVAVPPRWHGQTLRALDLRGRHRVVVVAVHDVQQDRLTVPPDPDTPLGPTETLLLAGDDDALRRLLAVD